MMLNRTNAAGIHNSGSLILKHLYQRSFAFNFQRIYFYRHTRESLGPVYSPGYDRLREPTWPCSAPMPFHRSHIIGGKGHFLHMNEKLGMAVFFSHCVATPPPLLHRILRGKAICFGQVHQRISRHQTSIRIPRPPPARYPRSASSMARGDGAAPHRSYPVPAHCIRN